MLSGIKLPAAHLKEEGTPFFSGVPAMRLLPVWVVFGLLLCAGCSGDKSAMKKPEAKATKDAAREQDFAHDHAATDNSDSMAGGGGGGKEAGPKHADKKPAQDEAP